MLWLWLLASIGLLGALTAQVIAVPALAPVSGAPPAVEQQPTPPSDSPTLAGEFAHLPVVMRSFSDAASSAAAAEVAHANVIDANAEMQAFDDTWVTLQLRSTASSSATTVIVLLLATVIVALLANSPARVSLAVIAVFAAILGMAVHETGHAVAARLLHRDVDAAAAPGGLAVVLLMIPLRLIGGPYLGHRVVAEAPPEVAADADAHKAYRRRNLLVYLAGPLANAVVLVACTVAYIVQPVPALLVVLLVQLGIITFSLLPLKPLEGATLEEEHRRLVGLALFALVAVGVLFARDVL